MELNFNNFEKNKQRQIVLKYKIIIGLFLMAVPILALFWIRGMPLVFFIIGYPMGIFIGVMVSTTCMGLHLAFMAVMTLMKSKKILYLYKLIYMFLAFVVVVGSAALVFKWLRVMDFHLSYSISSSLGTLLGGVIGGFIVLRSIMELRMFRKTKDGRFIYEMSNGLAFGEELDMKMCEEFAAKGYRLVGFTKKGYYKFERAEPEKCCFSVDYAGKKLNADELNEYITIFESGGWTYACGYYDIHWFRAPKGTTPIYTDNESLVLKYKVMRRSALRDTAFVGFMLVISIACFIILNTFEGTLDYSWVRGVFIAARFMLIITIIIEIWRVFVMVAAVVINHRRILFLRDGR